MTSTLDAYHQKISAKIDYLEQISEILNSHESEITNLASRYREIIAPILLKHYQNRDNALVEEFCSLILSENIINKFDNILEELIKVIENFDNSENSHIDSKKFENIDLVEELQNKFKKKRKTLPRKKLNRLIVRYRENKLVFNIKRDNITNCPKCNDKMCIWSELSELQCNSCSYVETLQGVIFDDNQIFGQQVMISRTKKYDPNAHCAKWLDSLLAQEDSIIPEHVIEKIEHLAVQEYTRNNRVRSMVNMKCSEIRNWLKRFGYSAYYNNAPKIRKIITSRHGESVVPPELTSKEKEKILIEYQLTMNAFNEVVRDEQVLRLLGKNKIRNKLYNPFILWQIINHVLSGDPRLTRLLETIHLQSQNTLVKNDIIWRKICEIRNIPYYATDANQIY